MRFLALTLLIVFTLTSACPPSALALRQVGLEEGKKADLVSALQPTAASTLRTPTGLEERPKFLIVEDMLSTRARLKQIVRQQYPNAVTVTASTVQEARTAWEQRGPFVRILTDGQLPDGWSTRWLEDLQRQGALERTGIVVISAALGSAPALADLQAALVVETLSKPFMDDQEVVARLKSLARRLPLPATGLEEGRTVFAGLMATPVLPTAGLEEGERVSTEEAVNRIWEGIRRGEVAMVKAFVAGERRSRTARSATLASRDAVEEFVDEVVLNYGDSETVLLRQDDQIREIHEAAATGLEETGADKAAAGAAAEWPASLQAIAAQRDVIRATALSRGRLYIYLDPSLFQPGGDAEQAAMAQVVFLTTLAQQTKRWLGVPVEAYYGIPNPAVASVALRIIRALDQPPAGWTIAVANLFPAQSLPEPAFHLLIAQAFLTPDQPQTVNADLLLAGKVGLEEVRRTLAEIFN